MWYSKCKVSLQIVNVLCSILNARYHTDSGCVVWYFKCKVTLQIVNVLCGILNVRYHYG